MSLLTGTLDGNAQQASRFLEDSRKLAPDLPWLKRTDTRLGQLALTLESNPHAPYSTFTEASGRATFVLGDTLHETQLDNAAWLHAQCRENGPEMLARQNGYYLAGMIDEHDAIYLAADQLGLMPLYYWAGADHFSFSTSPNAFLSHPGFTAKPDLMGIAGILLTMHGTGNRTTWQDVHRLPPGHLLRWRAGEGVRLTEVNALKAHDSYFGWSPSHCQTLIQNNFNDAVKRLNRLGETSVLLSGGLDSRLVAGCLRWHAQPKVPAITLGKPTDYEMQCAASVAKSCGWPMHTVDVSVDAYPAWAPVQARLEGMQTSFVNFMWWQALDTIQDQKARIMTGFLGDAIMGGSQIEYAFDQQKKQYNFDTQFARANRYGFSPETVSQLLGQPDLGQTVMGELKTTWDRYDGHDFQKAWLYSIHQRQRLHIGANAWRLTFGAWHSTPYIDQDLMHVMAGMAAPAFAERRAQYGMLCNKFPKLAALPLDRGGPNMEPMMPNRVWRLKHRLISPIQALIDKGRQVERRQYVRHYDINSRGWNAIRVLAENHRGGGVGDIFDSQILNETLPAPELPLATPDPVVDGSRYKTLLGLLLQPGAQNQRPST